MRLDMTKPYGTVYGHQNAVFEQNGKLFSASGELLDPVAEMSDADIQFAEEQARDFLKGILAGGPILRSAIYKECQANNQNWDIMQNVFMQLGEEQRIRNGVFWKLKTE